MTRDWIDDELWNWSRWANSGPAVGPIWPLPPSPAARMYIAPRSFEDNVNAPPPINYRNAEIVQRVWGVLCTIERKVLQAEYLSPWNYGRRRGKAAAARRLRISVVVYENHLRASRELVRRAFG